MLEEYRNTLTIKQMNWLANVMHDKSEFWVALIKEVLRRGRYSESQRILLNEMGQLIRTQKNTDR